MTSHTRTKRATRRQNPRGKENKENHREFLFTDVCVSDEIFEDAKVVVWVLFLIILYANPFSFPPGSLHLNYFMY